ncbi:hypothetical protein BAZSYMA_ACONTIG81756_0 [Bathymodiolus azoricus thioautotrophic gill symbiont]|uniref:Uncharacterized protein n=1 Tax=Bathymodiolus azoricus thioautotrophic gill symbiont TaxID=235205 RepID=A0A1H6LJN2_9GAMM|nr:hypothetical protein BAZSYMA_ACONTIG81756_0 [Bathymodiolus azoricus thioautotrophic gill symbiont]
MCVFFHVAFFVFGFCQIKEGLIYFFDQLTRVVLVM